MDCPRCGRVTREILSDGAPIDFCPGCKGSWLDRGEEPNFTAEPVWKALHETLLKPARSEMTCPKCAGAMTEGGLLFPTFRIDRCDACGGFWFDSRELSRLRDPKMLEAGENARAIPPEPEVTRSGPGAEPRPARSARTGPSAPRAARCPSCQRPPAGDDRWLCRCGRAWNAFSTDGKCPNCGVQYDNTQCLKCYEWSLLQTWFKGG